jgi:hypothetical protein
MRGDDSESLVVEEENTISEGLLVAHNNQIFTVI